MIDLEKLPFFTSRIMELEYRIALLTRVLDIILTKPIPPVTRPTTVRPLLPVPQHETCGNTIPLMEPMVPTSIPPTPVISRQRLITPTPLRKLRVMTLARAHTLDETDVTEH